MNIVPLFKSHYSLGKSLLTLDEPGKAKPGNPVSVYDLATAGGLKEVVLLDDRIDGFIQAYKMADKLGMKLCYGVELTVCATMGDKTIESRRTESKVVIFAKDYEGYQSIIRIWNRSWGPEGHFSCRIAGNDLEYGRADWGLLSSFWTDNLIMGLPFFSSFIAVNTLTFHQIMPTLPQGVTPWVFREVQSELPFSFLIDAAIDRFVAGGGTRPECVVPAKTICYNRRADLKPYIVARAMQQGGTWDEPDVDHLHSSAFSWEAYRELTQGAVTTQSIAA